MGIKVYISGISGNKEVKKRQQRVLMILDSKNIKYDVVDIAEPGNEDAKEFMQNNAKSFGATIGDANPRSPLPPQIFNDDNYCGDYDQFDMANEIDEIEKFLKLPHDNADKTIVSNAELKLGNGEVNAHIENEIETVTKEITEESESKKDNEDQSIETKDVPNDEQKLQEKTDDEKPVEEVSKEAEDAKESLENGGVEESLEVAAEA